MSKQTEALKLALENICAVKLCEFNSMSSRHEMIRLMDAAIAAIREALAEQPASKPLTDEQIDAIWDAVITPSNHIREFVRAIEAAHGIGDRRTK